MFKVYVTQDECRACNTKDVDKIQKCIIFLKNLKTGYWKASMWMGGMLIYHCIQKMQHSFTCSKIKFIFHLKFLHTILRNNNLKKVGFKFFQI